MKKLTQLTSSISKRLEKAAINSEFDAKELQGFAAAFGVSGKPVRGDEEAITSDWGLTILPKHGMAMVDLLKKLKYTIEDQKDDDGYITFTSPSTSGSTSVQGSLSFDVLKEGDCVLTVTGI